MPGSTAGPAVDVPAACDLLAEADIEAAVGHPVEGSSSDAVTCFWRPLGEAAGYAVVLTLAELDASSCLSVHGALGDSTVFDFESSGVAGVPGFWQYRETLAGTHVAAYELCTAGVNVGLRVESPEGAPADEAGQRAIADQLARLALERLGDAPQG